MTDGSSSTTCRRRSRARPCAPAPGSSGSRRRCAKRGSCPRPESSACSTRTPICWRSTSPPDWSSIPARAAPRAPWSTGCSTATRSSPAWAAPGGPASSTASTRTPAACCSWRARLRRTASWSALFASRAIDKRYLAIVYGAPAAASGTIEAPIARHRIERQRMTVRAGGRPATTGWRTLAAAGAVALLELDAPHRTHPPDPGPPQALRAPADRRSGLRRSALAGRHRAGEAGARGLSAPGAARLAAAPAPSQRRRRADARGAGTRRSRRALERGDAEALAGASGRALIRTAGEAGAGSSPREVRRSAGRDRARSPRPASRPCP